MKLTRKQATVLQTIKEYVEQRNYPPSVRELTAILGLKSCSTAHGYLQQLKKKGYISWEADKPRTLHLINGGEAV